MQEKGCLSKWREGSKSVTSSSAQLQGCWPRPALTSPSQLGGEGELLNHTQLFLSKAKHCPSSLARLHRQWSHMCVYGKRGGHLSGMER